MAKIYFEYRFESDGDTSPEDVENTKALLKQWIAKKLFQQSVNGGLQVWSNVNIQLESYTADDANFEVVDGWAEPSLKYKPKT